MDLGHERTTIDAVSPALKLHLLFIHPVYFTIVTMYTYTHTNIQTYTPFP